MADLDARAVARLLRVAPATVWQWRWRGLLPPPTGMISGRPWWDQAVIEQWAQRTGRLRR